MREDLSNAELLEKLTELLQGKKEEKEEEEEEEKEMADYKTFMKECMAEGKSLKECADEWKKKYPEPKEEEKEGAEEDLEEDEKMSTLEARVAELEGKLHMEKVTNEVAELVHAKHLSPRQKDPIIKLSSRMTEDMREEFFEVFRTQKFTVSEDKGVIASSKPGDPEEIDEETRKRIMESHGISDLINDRGVKKN